MTEQTAAEKALSEILHMIIDADATDTAKLDEIDARLHHFLNSTTAPSPNACDYPRYTRSRDALKDIRPKDWRYTIEMDANGTSCCMASIGKSGHLCGMASEDMATEELAELNAIIRVLHYNQTSRDLLNAAFAPDPEEDRGQE